jgi:asparagine synthase (glutamine-hydrolysing)
MDNQWGPQLLYAPASVKPQIQAVVALLDSEPINQVSVHYAAQSVWTGQGGDHLFWQERNPLGAADYALVCGIRPGLVRAITDSAHLSRMSYASVIRTTWNALLSKKTRTRNIIGSIQNRFVNTDALPSNLIEYTCSPWTSAANSLPPGKQMQTLALADLLNRHRPLPGIERVCQHHPLISQPLIELCLRIPTYLLLHNGRSRSLARSAFKNHIPIEICDREDKGSITSTVTSQIRGNEAFVREILMDGVLVREHIIERETVDRCIVNREPLRATDVRPLLACIAAEVWYRSWNTATLNAARPAI